MTMPTAFVQFLSMAQGYVHAFESLWDKYEDDELRALMRQASKDRQLRYEGWLIGFMDAFQVEYPGHHQELAMRVVLQSFR